MDFQSCLKVGSTVFRVSRLFYLATGWLCLAFIPLAAALPTDDPSARLGALDYIQFLLLVVMCFLLARANGKIALLCRSLKSDSQYPQAVVLARQASTLLVVGFCTELVGFLIGLPSAIRNLHEAAPAWQYYFEFFESCMVFVTPTWGGAGNLVLAGGLYCLARFLMQTQDLQKQVTNLKEDADLTV